MRVVCLVPSLTETLLHCGVDVVGRTRFCIHPTERVKAISIVGGTKGVDWEKISALAPDLVVFDKEENLKSMAEACSYPWHATHITSIGDIAENLFSLATVLQCEPLKQHADEWRQLASRPNLENIQWSNLPGQLKGLKSQKPAAHIDRIEYVIWRDPWMAVGANTFIGSVLSKVGFSDYLATHDEPYPVLAPLDLQRDDTFYLFSSEPYPFLKHIETLKAEAYQGAIVDGEFYSWFGVRSYRAIKNVLDAAQANE